MSLSNGLKVVESFCTSTKLKTLYFTDDAIYIIAKYLNLNLYRVLFPLLSISQHIHLNYYKNDVLIDGDIPIKSDTTYYFMMCLGKKQCKYEILY